MNLLPDYGTGALTTDNWMMMENVHNDGQEDTTATTTVVMT